MVKTNWTPSLVHQILMHNFAYSTKKGSPFPLAFPFSLGTSNNWPTYLAFSFPFPKVPLGLEFPFALGWCWLWWILILDSLHHLWRRGTPATCIVLGLWEWDSSL